MRVSQARHLTPLHHMLLLCNALNTEEEDGWQSKSRRGHQPPENKTMWSIGTGDEQGGKNTATDVRTLMQAYRGDSNARLLRADTLCYLLSLDFFLSHCVVLNSSSCLAPRPLWFLSLGDLLSTTFGYHITFIFVVSLMESRHCG